MPRRRCKGIFRALMTKMPGRTVDISRECAIIKVIHNLKIGEVFRAEPMIETDITGG